MVPDPSGLPFFQSPEYFPADVARSRTEVTRDLFEPYKALEVLEPFVLGPLAHAAKQITSIRDKECFNTIDDLTGTSVLYFR